MVEYDFPRVPEGMDLVEDMWIEEKLVEFLDADSDCERVSLMGSPIEAMVDYRAAEAIDFFESKSRGLNIEKAKRFREGLRNNKAILVHQTNKKSARKILENGFSSPLDDYGVREDKVFFWPHFRDMGEHMGGNGTFVVSKAQIEDILISSYKNFGFISSGLITEEEYNENHVFKLKKYVECLKRDHRPGEPYTVDSMLGAVIEGQKTW